MRPGLLVAVLVVVVAATAGCGQVDDLSFPTPPPTSATSVAPVTAAASAVSQMPVSSGPVPSVALGPGRASITGTVTGPSGPVAGAVVHVERLVGDAVAAEDVTTQADGSWKVPGILGGRYRVRSWRAPDLALTTPDIFFLADDASQAIGLKVAQVAATAVDVAVDPDPPVVGAPTGLAVQLHTESVDAGGIVRGQAVAGATVELADALTWTVADPNPTQTGPTGRATWQVVCGAAGPQPLAVIVNDTDVYPLSVPACVAPPPPSTTTTSAASTSTSGVSGQGSVP